MPVKHSRHVVLTEQLSAFIERGVAEGRYPSASAIVQAGLQLLLEREHAFSPDEFQVSQPERTAGKTK